MTAAEQAAAAEKQNTQDGALELPEGTTEVRINLGPNLDPLINCPEDGTAVCLLFELASPIAAQLKERYNGRKNTMVFNVGISDSNGIAAFPLLNSNAWQSTSLNKVAHKEGWNTGAAHGSMDHAAVMTLAEVFASIDQKVPITKLATDIQGNDFKAIKSAGEALKRVKEIVSEVYQDGHASYDGVHNALDADWKPYMTAMGFELSKCTGAFKDKHSSELNCEFSNKGPVSS